MDSENLLLLGYSLQQWPRMGVLPHAAAARHATHVRTAGTVSIGRRTAGRVASVPVTQPRLQHPGRRRVFSLPDAGELVSDSSAGWSVVFVPHAPEKWVLRAFRRKLYM